MILRDEILKTQECPPELEENLSNLLFALNQFRVIYGLPMIVTRGYSTSEHNATIPGAAKDSAHLYCMAADFYDPTPHDLRWFCLKNQNILAQCGLYMEAPTSGDDPHVHLTTRPPASGNRVFIA